MKRYKFVIKLSDGNEIQGASVGNSHDEAVERLLALPQTTEFISSAQVIDAVLVGEETVRPVPADRFVLQRATDPGWWVVGDPEGMFVIRFKEQDFWKSHTNLTHPGKYFRPSKVKIMRPTSPK